MPKSLKKRNRKSKGISNKYGGNYGLYSNNNDNTLTNDDITPETTSYKLYKALYLLVKGETPPKKKIRRRTKKKIERDIEEARRIEEERPVFHTHSGQNTTFHGRLPPPQVRRFFSNNE